MLHSLLNYCKKAPKSAIFYRKGNRNCLCIAFMLLCMLLSRLGKAVCCTCISYFTLVRVKKHRAEASLQHPYILICQDKGLSKGNITAKT